ncbi:GlsB/YeaQ/YmgE family stress response membrane protein [Agrobacterium sp. ES01]|uniref:GlsB/YeaQ/YmgE family stress response membrane protein n=1 Tax=Agrobacterium sp. ES01 TaxID=3420714 RepID=UPI003D1111F6
MALLPAVIAGWLTGILVLEANFGALGDMMIGVIGGLIAIYMPPLAGVHLVGYVGTVITPALCAVILSLVCGTLRKL